jgi:phage-related protein
MGNGDSRRIKDRTRSYLKKLTNTDGIWEIRVQLGSDIFRILGFFENHNFIATNGFCKKSQKTPSSEIGLAEKRKCEYYCKETR